LLGLVDFQRGETVSAIQHYKKALALQPNSYSGHYNLALAYLRQHRLQDGRSELERAVKLDPNFVLAWAYLSSVQSGAYWFDPTAARLAAAKEALDRLLQRYTGFKILRTQGIPRDARRGAFRGLDGRMVPLPGETQRDREHLCMSGYLQNGEAIIIKKAAIITDARCRLEKLPWQFVNIVHDELQSEVKNSLDIALKVAKIKAEAIHEAGEIYKLKCPMAGSYWNDDRGDYTIGTNWYKTH